MKGRAAVAWIADRRRVCVVPLLLTLLSWCETASAAQPAEPEVARCIRQAARGQIWLEKTLWGLRDQEAGWIGAEILNKDGSHDLGPLQINSWWVPRIAALLSRRENEVRRWLQFDPCFNAEVARWIFLDALRTSGSYWKAVGIYHSPNGARQRRYAALVAVHLQKRFGADVFSRRAIDGLRTSR
nr:lytic transglycosylase domain-containing protein [Sphingobium sp. AP50]